MRETYKNARLSVATVSADEKSLEICRKVFSTVDWSKVKRMCSYTPIQRLKEVNVVPLHDTVRYKFPEIDIELLKPDKDQALPATKFDLIIVPCLAFDKHNYRLGWGGGFYDRFLAGQPQALKVGVAYQNGFVKEDLPRQPHDIPMDTIVTER